MNANESLTKGPKLSSAMETAEKLNPATRQFEQNYHILQKT